MSFIGADGLENQVRQLKQQLAAKDQQLSSIQNEQMKKADEVSEARRLKEGALYQLSAEADKAHKAETALKAKTLELTRTKLQLDNLETSLQAANERLKIEEKEKSRLQYDIDSQAANGTSGAATKRLQEQRATLEARVRDLESALRKSESEKETLRVESSGTGWGIGQPSNGRDKSRLIGMEQELSSLRAENIRLMDENRKVSFLTQSLVRQLMDRKATTMQASSPREKKASFSSNFFGSSPAPAAPRSRTTSRHHSPPPRRRASSVSSSLKIHDLENEIEALRAAQGPSGAELETMKTQLNNTKKELLKVENEKIAVEKSSKKEIDRLKSTMEDQMFELESYRSDGGVSKDDVEKIKKSATEEKMSLQKRVESLQADIEKRCAEIVLLEQKVLRVSEVEAELLREKNLRTQREQAPIHPATASPSEVQALTEKIAVLESQLSSREPSSSSSTSNIAGDTKSIRQLQRELAALRREKEALEIDLKENDDLLAEREAEILALRGAIPIPDSPSSRPKDGKLEKVLAELEAANHEIERVNAELESMRGDMAALNQDREFFEGQLDGAKMALIKKEERVVQLEVDIGRLQTLLAKEQEDAGSLRSCRTELQTQLDSAAVAYLEKETALQQLIDDRSADDARIAELRAEVGGAKERIVALEAEVSEFQTSQEAWVASQAVITAELATALEIVQRSREEVDSLKAKRDEIERDRTQSVSKLQLVEDRLRNGTAEVSNLRKEVRDAQAESTKMRAVADENQALYEAATTTIAQLRTRIAGLDDDLTNRTSESDRQKRDDDILALRDLLERAEVEKTRLEKEIEKTLFQQSQDAALAQQRIESLNARLSELDTISESTARATNLEEAQHVGLLHSKIQRLRAERDELRQAISFAQHERHFTVQAAEADRASAIEELGKVRSDLKATSATCDNLRTESMELRKKLDEAMSRAERVSASFAVASADKDDLEDKLSHLQLEIGHAITERDGLKEEVDHLALMLRQSQENLKVSDEKVQRSVATHQEQATQLAELVGQWTKTRDDLSWARSESAAAHRANNDLEARIDRLQSVLSASRPSSTSPNEGSESGTAVVMSMVQDLEAERADLSARIDRRNAQIATLQKEVQKLKASLVNAQDSAEEFEAEVAEATRDKEELESRINAQSLELAEQTVTVASASSRITALESRLCSMTQSEFTSRLALGSHEARAAALEVLLESETAIGESRTESLKNQLESLSAHSAAVHVSHSEIVGAMSTELCEVISSLEKVREDLASIEADRDGLLVEISTLKEELEISRAREVGLQHDQLQAAASISTELEEARASLQAVEQRLADVEAERDSVSGELDATKTELETLRDGEVDRQHGVELGEERIVSLLAQIRASKETIAALNLDITRLSSELEQSNSAARHLQSDLDNAEARTTEITASSESVMESLKDRNEHLEQELADTIKDNQGRLSRLEGLEAANAALAETEMGLRAQLERLGDVAAREAEWRQNLEASRQVVETQALGLESLQSKVNTLEKETKKANGLLRMQEAETKTISEKLKTVQGKWAAAVKDAEIATALVRQQGIEVARLEAEIAKLKSAPPPASSESTAELQDRIAELEASLSLRIQEVDEHGDNQRELLKIKVKLEKKVSKLQRQLATAETAANTAANRVPAPIIERPPLRSVNIFEPPPSVGSKRSREGDVDEKPAPVECIMLPPSIPSSAKKAVIGRSAFTPQRGGNAFAPTPKTQSKLSSNPFAKESTTPRNAFQVLPEL
ncbi:hypothetical protein P7C73_g4309, partial [Tremellales sp. Uapishka_1]